MGFRNTIFSTTFLHLLSPTALTSSFISSILFLCNFLLHHSLFLHRSNSTLLNFNQRRRLLHREGSPPEECAICLCEMEEGEEVAELRCNHRFHGGCLDRWVGCGRCTCPLCRGWLMPPPPTVISTNSYMGGGGVQVVMFNFCEGVVGDSSGHMNWWLR